MNNINADYIGKVRLQFDELTSTNDYARTLAAQKDIAEGTVIMADRQTNGRGQMGTHWESNPGENLTMSIILRPFWVAADQQTSLSKVAALAALETVLPLHLPSAAAIKWPNDLIINQKKIAGILIENTLSGSFLDTSIIGIGININQLSFAPHLPFAGSLQQIIGHPLQPAILAEVFFERLTYWYERLRQQEHEIIHVHYLQHLLGYQKQQQFELVSTGDIFDGIIQNVDQNGLLCISTTDGIRRFAVKEIRQPLG